MSNFRNLSINSRQNSLSSLSSSMESLSSAHTESFWHDLVPTSTAFTIPRSKVKTSDYDTGFSAAEYDEDKKQTRKVGRVRKVRIQRTRPSVAYINVFICMRSLFVCLCIIKDKGLHFLFSFSGIFIQPNIETQKDYC